MAYVMEPLLPPACACQECVFYEAEARLLLCLRLLEDEDTPSTWDALCAARANFTAATDADWAVVRAYYAAHPDPVRAFQVNDLYAAACRRFKRAQAWLLPSVPPRT